MERLSSYRVGRCGGCVSCGLGAGLEEIADSGFRIAELDERAVRRVDLGREAALRRKAQWPNEPNRAQRDGEHHVNSGFATN